MSNTQTQFQVHTAPAELAAIEAHAYHSAIDEFMSGTVDLEFACEVIPSPCRSAMAGLHSVNSVKLCRRP